MKKDTNEWMGHGERVDYLALKSFEPVLDNLITGDEAQVYLD